MTDSPQQHLQAEQGTVRCFVVEASRHNPSTHQGHGRLNLAERELCATQAATSRSARDLLQRGYWVEVFGRDSCELLAGPFDPEQALPAYIV